MKIDNFEYYVDDIILGRGRDLFEKDSVNYRDNIGANWYFTLKGTKLYHIVICLHKNGTISFARCDCAYAKQFDICKHIVACLFYLRNKLGVKKETMLSMFLNKNTELVKEKDYLKISKKFAQSIFRKIQHGGFIEYDYMPVFAQMINELLEYYENNSEILKDRELLLKLCLFLINTISKTKYNCDDSNGEITDSFFAVTHFIEQNILIPATMLFSLIYAELTNPKNEYDFERCPLIELAGKFIQTDIDRQRLESYLKNLIETSEYPEHLQTIYNDLF